MAAVSKWMICAVCLESRCHCEFYRSIGYAAEIDRRLKLVQIERAARDFIKHGLRLTPGGLIVREHSDGDDPHRRLCDALDALEPLNPGHRR